MAESDHSLPDFDRDVPALRTFAMPKDLNGNGDVFGGWVMSQMDLAGAAVAARRAQGRLATVGVEAMKFLRPISVGDEVNFYAAIERVGRTSIRVRIDVWARHYSGKAHKVTEGVFTYVAIGEGGRPRPVPTEA
ncbi:acyl-CoA thioesterase [Oleisolibacter albus]|uniref:acyl-CoA thioesterase n=1 Tax=Oleisolibacter albus TaxID=2171757 RepID=UPI000DF3B00F|nr:acyl-CoA thioesterase [Oleisolibacter albus]